jgi:hypothetical protein
MNNTLPIEQRIARLEGRLGWLATEVKLSNCYLAFAIISGLLAIYCAYLGLGLPNHYYQAVLAVLTVAICYQKNIFARPRKIIHWAIAAVNSLSLTLLFKILIGGGVRRPLSWLLYPNISIEKGAAPDKWLDVPSLSLQWQESAASTLSFDLTVIQTFLLLITILGAFFSFQPFASLTAFFLVFVSLPALVGFNWDWVFPAMILAGLSFYLQSSELNREEQK